MNRERKHANSFQTCLLGLGLMGLWGLMGTPLMAQSQEYLAFESRLHSLKEAENWSGIEEITNKALEVHEGKEYLEMHALAHTIRALDPYNQLTYELAQPDMEAIDSLLKTEHSGKTVALPYHLGNLNYFLQVEKEANHFYKIALQRATQSEHSLLFQVYTGLSLVATLGHQSRTSIHYMQEALEVATRKGSAIQQAEALNQLATIYFSIGNWDSSRLYFEQLLSIKREGDPRELISDLTQLGDMLSSQGKFAEGQTYHLEALQVAEKLNDSLLLGGILTDLSQGYVNQEDWPKAMLYSQRALKMLEFQQFPHARASNFYINGLARYHSGESTQALVQLDRALSIYDEVGELRDEKVRIQLLKAEILTEDASYDKALGLLKEVLKKKETYSTKPDMLEVNLTMARVYLQKGQNKQAISHLKKARDLSYELKSPRSLERTLDLLSRAYAREGSYKMAYQWQEEQGKLRDSLFNADRAMIVSELEARYTSEQKDRQNAELKAEVNSRNYELEKNKSTILQKTQQIYLLIGGLLLLSLLLFLITYRQRQRKKLMQERLHTLEKEIETQNLRAVLQGEEKERQRVGRELHDGLGALLASIKALFQTLEVEFPGANSSKHYQKADELLDHACQEVRSISHNMVSTSLQEYGLEQAIYSLAQLTQNNHHLQVEPILFGNMDSAAEEVQISIYRMVQELLRNIVKHAEAKEVLIQVSAEEDQILVTVEDDGKGFDATEVLNKGIGLQNIKTRIDYLKGNMEIDSQKGVGTTVLLEIPLPQEKIGEGAPMKTDKNT
ncbi:MAG: sensor histidine kinase [Bacteroidota bacterium]